jgi:hypothetical protein
MVVLSCHPSYFGVVNRKIAVQVGLGKNMRSQTLFEK